jgi:hypothetical protein
MGEAPPAGALNIETVAPRGEKALEGRGIVLDAPLLVRQTTKRT